jgi:uncharacterized protein (DUF924 family)
MEYSNVIKFWFQLPQGNWFKVDPQLDALISQQFDHTLRAATMGEEIEFLKEPGSSF